jgi:hypothetical protein
MHAMPMITEAALKTMVRGDITNPPSLARHPGGAATLSNIAQQHRSILAHPGQQLYPANGSRFDFSDWH